jgi:protein TonB
MLSIRIPIALGVGVLSSVAIFFALFELVNVPFDVRPAIVVDVIDFKRLRVDTPVETKRREKPTREPQVVTIVDAPRALTVDGPVTPVRAEPTKIAPPTRTGLPLGVDRDVTPLVRVNPAYPPREAARGTEGWVQVRFTVTVAGTVRDAVVVASEPGETFDDAALEAVARWRYNPRIDAGNPVERVGLETVFRFTLEN